MKNVCVVGYGAIGPTHTGALEAVENVCLYGICDVDAGKRRLCLERYGEKGQQLHEYDDFDRMLEDEQIDSVHICTPHYLHFEMIKKALAAGKDVVTEKPVTRTREEYRELLGLEGAERVCVVFQNRLNACIVRLKEMIESKELGEVKAARAFLTWYRNKAYYESGSWRGKWATEGGGLLINQAIHTLDYFIYLLGKAERVQANMFNYSLKDVIEVEDTLTACLHFESGVKGIFFATNAYTENSAPMFEVSFEKGVVRYADGKLWLNGEVIASDKSASGPKAYWGSGHPGLLKRFYEEEKYFSVQEAADTMETVFAIYESAKRGGEMVELCGFDM